MTQAARTSNNLFALRLAQEIQKNNATFIYSPVSFFAALGMTSLGATGNGWTEMQHVLFSQMKHLQQEQVHVQASDLVAQLAANSKETSLVMANRIFINSGFTAPQQFLSMTSKLYKSDTDAINVADAQGSAQKVNQWIAQVTHGLINDVLPASAISLSTVMILVNAIYFKGLWTVPFDKEQTRKDKFKGLKQVKQVDMMHMYGTPMVCSEQKNYTELRMPYKGNQFEMVFIKPNKSIKDLPLTEKLVQDVTSLKEYPCMLDEIAIPKMKLETMFQANDMLKDIGMPSIFQPGNLKGITEGSYISNVFHKAVIEIDEAGTVAAAATCVVDDDECEADEQEPKRFILDQPFYYFLLHRKSCAIVFMGQVTDL